MISYQIMQLLDGYLMKKVKRFPPFNYTEYNKSIINYSKTNSVSLIRVLHFVLLYDNP